MHWLDWILFAIPVALVIWAALYAQKYVHGVADFLSAGRVAGRYVICVAGAEAGMGLITLVGMLEAYYNSGYAYSFWSTLTAPVGMMLGLFGFCNFRFRETRAMTLGQFFEIRYNRPFRISACFVQALYGVVNYAIFPAVGARFLLYYLDLPINYTVFGITFSTFGTIMVLALGLACYIACAGGQITIMVTDCVQGILSYPIYLVIVAYFIYRFSWGEQMMPALLARPPHQSFLNPFDISELREFNLFYVISGLVGTFLFRLSWGGRGYDSSARNAHEAKMGSVLGTWRAGFSTMMYILIAVVALTFLGHRDFAKQAAEMRTALATKTLQDVVKDDMISGQSFAKERAELPAVYAAIPPREAFSETYATKEQYEAENADPYLTATSEALGGSLSPEAFSALPSAEQDRYNLARKRNQTFASIYNQMRVPMAMRHVLPVGLAGLFCAIAVFLMVSTDTTYLHAWASTIVQDFLLPLRKTPWKPARQINYIRIAIVGVALSAFIFSFYFGQVDFVMMFFAITGAIWSASGPVITFGLYWKRGTSAGAFVSLFVGAATAIAAIFAQKYWVPVIYPAIAKAGLVESFDHALRAISAPFNPYIAWSMTADKFPMSSAEVAFLVNIFTILLYVVVSLCTCRQPFNMARMLHRGEWADKADAVGAVTEKVPLLQRILGIDANYTRGDRILAWSVFLWSFGWCFVACFIGVLIWNAFSPWTVNMWGRYFFVTNIAISGVIGVISTVWFGICSTRDLFRLFRDLAARDITKLSDLDDGRVEGNVSVVDAEAFAAREKSDEK